MQHDVKFVNISRARWNVQLLNFIQIHTMTNCKQTRINFSAKCLKKPSSTCNKLWQNNFQFGRLVKFISKCTRTRYRILFIVCHFTHIALGYLTTGFHNDRWGFDLAVRNKFQAIYSVETERKYRAVFNWVS